jgi:hypothetical protein
MAQIARIRNAQISNGNVINADDLDAEFDQLVNESNSQDTRLTDIEDENLTLGGVKTFSDQAVFSSGFKTDTISEVSSANGVVVDSLKIKDGSLILPTATELTIASGAITVTQGLHTVDTEGDAATDNLDTINGVAANQIVYLKTANAARDVVLTNGVGNVYTPNGTSVTLSSTNQGLAAMGDGTNVFLLGAPAPSGKTVYSGATAAEAEITFGTASIYRITGWIRVLTDARNIAVQFSDGTYKTASYRYSATGRNDSGTGTGGASTSAAAILINGDNTIGNASGEYLGVDITVTAKGSTDAIYSGIRGSITTVNTSGVNITNNVSGIYTGTLADMTKMKFFSETGGSANGNITYSLTVEEMA